MSAPAPPAQPTRRGDRLFHDDLSPELQQVRTHVRAFAETHVLPVAREIGSAAEDAQRFPFALLTAMGSDGVLGLAFPDPIGGRGLAQPMTAAAVALEELAYVSSSVAAVYDVQCLLAGRTLLHAAPALQERYLRPLLAGEVVGAFATSEPGASSDLSPQALQTVGEARSKGEIILDGRKRFISNAPVADFVVVLCRTGDGPSLLLVDTIADGVQIGPPDHKLGNRGQLTADVAFDRVHVPTEHLIGAPGAGLRLALGSLAGGRIGIAACGVGLAQAAFDLAADHLTTRWAFGKPLASNQHWQFRLADRAAGLEAARALYRKAARRMDAGEPFPEPEAAMAKFTATELAVDTARDAVQALGGYGFVSELGADGRSYRTEELYRDAKIGEIYEGANEIQRWIVARNIFGKEVTG